MMLGRFVIFGIDKSLWFHRSEYFSAFQVVFQKSCPSNRLFIYIELKIPFANNTQKHINHCVIRWVIRGNAYHETDAYETLEYCLANCKYGVSVVPMNFTILVFAKHSM